MANNAALKKKQALKELAEIFWRKKEQQHKTTLDLLER